MFVWRPEKNLNDWGHPSTQETVLHCNPNDPGRNDETTAALTTADIPVHLNGFS